MTHVVLLVDDEPNVLSALTRSLRGCDLEILRATSGPQALEAFGTARVDAVVTDSEMPGMKGSELLARVRAIAPTCVRMMLTGKPTLRAVVDAVNRGEIQRFFLKPCDAGELAVALTQCLREKDLVEEARRLLIELRRRDAVLQGIQRAYPNVGELHTDAEGCVVVEDVPVDIDELIAEMQRATQGREEIDRRRSA